MTEAKMLYSTEVPLTGILRLDVEARPGATREEIFEAVLREAAQLSDEELQALIECELHSAIIEGTVFRGTLNELRYEAYTEDEA